MNKMWGPYTIDRFASSHNKKLKRFNSMFLNQGSESVYCFCQNWRDENIWLVPPVLLIIKAIKYLVSCQTKDTLIVPKWSSSPFWTFIFGENLCYREYVLDFIEFKNPKNILQTLDFVESRCLTNAAKEGGRIRRRFGRNVGI